MTRVLIIEDELPAADRITKLISNLGEVNILNRLDSIESAIEWFQNNEAPDIAFFDIQLADGKSFSIFEKCEVNCPIIFTTAFDEYALKAFKVNSIDYLLKPIEEVELKAAWQKFQTLKESKGATDYKYVAEQLKASLKQTAFKTRFLIKSGEQFKFIQASHISYLFSDNGMTFLVNDKGEQFLIDEKLETLEGQLNPEQFHRISRKFIIRDMSISKISSYFNGRLILELDPHHTSEVIVARERVSTFKTWLDQ